jgi:hypothetical protein
VSWSIVHGGNNQPLEYHGLSNLRRRRLNQGRDEVTFHHSSGRTLDNPPLFSAFDTIRILRDGGGWFQGVVTHIPSHGSADDESREYRVAGPWWYLENIIYQQPWNLATDPTAADSSLASTLRSHIILGQDLDGQPLTIRGQLLNILDYAIAAGATFTYQIGEEELQQAFPPDECRDLSCAEAVQRILRWVPDARLWFDYTEEMPVLRITRRATAVATSFPIGDSLRSLTIGARHDLQICGVVLKYERQHRNGELTWRTLEIDRFPPSVEETQPRVLILTVELAGIRSRYLTQQVHTATIEPDSVTWWKDHLPALATVPDNSIQLSNISRTSELPRELTDGSIANWMDVATEWDTVRATIAYATGDMEVAAQDVAVRLRATDAWTKTYSQLASYTEEEEMPIGLAQLLYESFPPFPHEGTLRWEDGEVRPISFDWAVNISGGPAAWENMAGEIQECEEEVARGVVRLRFGPPTHLGLRQLIQMTRVNRRREAVRGSYVRASGRGDGEDVELPDRGAWESGHMGNAIFGKLLLTHAGENSRKIILDANLIGRDNLVLQPREEYVVENGVLMKRLSIASQPYMDED